MMYKVYTDSTPHWEYKTEEEVKEMFTEYCEANEVEETEEEFNAWMFDCDKRYDLIHEVSKEDIEDRLIELFTDEEDVFNEAIEDLDSYNGYLGDDRYYNMAYDFDEIVSGWTPSEAIQRAFYGYDEDSYDRTSGQYKESFNPNAKYFRFNGYGNLVYTNYKGYSSFLDRYTVREMLDANLDVFNNGDEFEELAKAWNNAE